MDVLYAVNFKFGRISIFLLSNDVKIFKCDDPGGLNCLPYSEKVTASN